jgi:hypothetical protein
MSKELTPRWTRLEKIEETKTPEYFIDGYTCPVDSEELRTNHLSEPPVLHAFAVFDLNNNYLLSYALEMRLTTRLKTDAEGNETEEEYIGYFLETYCEHQRFSCKNFKEIEPDFDTVKAMVLSFVIEHDAVPKMLDYDHQSAQMKKEE